MPLDSLSAPRLVFCALLNFAILATARAADELRTWTDSTGRHQVSAKLESAEGGKVTLVRENGEKLTIALEKLSQADREYVAKLNAENPFKPADQGPGMPAPAGPGREPPETSPRTVDVDWTRSQMIALDAAASDWKIAPPDARPLGFRPRSAALPPKTDFFEKLSGMAINPAAKKAVVGYTLARHGSEATTRILFCDIERGRTLSSGASSGQMAPMALQDDGEHVLMRRNEFGFGNSDRLEIWSLRGKEVVRSLVWTPYGDAHGAARDVMWAEFVDASTLATSSRGGRVALWDLAAAQPICHFELVDGAVPAMSADRKWIAFCSHERMGLFDVAKREVAVVQETPARLTWPYLAFSPSGRKVGCIAQDRILVWDTASGRLENNFATPGIHIHGAIDFPDDGFILAANQFLITLDSQLKLWQYQGAEHVRTVGGTTFLAVSGFNGPGGLAAAKLPHAEAASLLEKALKQPDLFVFHQGTPVKLNVSGIPDPQRSRVADALTKKLTQMKCPIQPDAAIELAAGVEGPKERKVSYMHSGEYTVQEYRTSVKFLDRQKTVWETGGTNVPGILMLKKGENVGEALRRASAEPSYEFFDRVVLPEFLQKPSDAGRPGGGQTLGACKVTPAGFR
jgi:hypothetical protein